MPRIETVLAALTLLACAVLLLRLVLAPRRRERLDAWFARAWWALRALPARLRGGRKRGPAAAAKAAMKSATKAEREAQAAIDRARRKAAEREGNVVRPEAFRRPRKPH